MSDRAPEGLASQYEVAPDLDAYERELACEYEHFEAWDPARAYSNEVYEADYGGGTRRYRRRFLVVRETGERETQRAYIVARASSSATKSARALRPTVGAKSARAAGSCARAAWAVSTRSGPRSITCAGRVMWHKRAASRRARADVRYSDLFNKAADCRRRARSRRAR